MTASLAVPEPLSEEEEDFLRVLARTLVFLPRTFIADLGREHELSMSEFFTLMHLSDSPQGRLRMGDLASETALSMGAVTRVVKLLEAKRLVERAPSGADGRVHQVGLTDAGRERLARAMPAHVASVRRRIFDKVEASDVLTFTAALERICADASTSHEDKRTRA